MRQNFRLLRTIRLLSVALLLLPYSAHAQSIGLDGVISRVDSLNTALIQLGGVLAVTGFIWSLLAVLGRVGGAAMAISCLVAGMAIANAQQIVGFVVGG